MVTYALLPPYWITLCKDLIRFANTYVIVVVFVFYHDLIVFHSNCSIDYVHRSKFYNECVNQ